MFSASVLLWILNVDATATSKGSQDRRSMNSVETQETRLGSISHMDVAFGHLGELFPAHQVPADLFRAAADSPLDTAISHAQAFLYLQHAPEDAQASVTVITSDILASTAAGLSRFGSHCDSCSAKLGDVDNGDRDASDVLLQTGAEEIPQNINVIGKWTVATQVESGAARQDQTLSQWWVPVPNVDVNFSLPGVVYATGDIVPSPGNLFARAPGASFATASPDGGGPSLLAAAIAACLVSAFCLAGFRLPNRRAKGVSAFGSFRERVEAMKRCTVEEVTRECDCMVPRPRCCQQLLRLEASVVGALGRELTAPLMQQACVMYSSVVLRQLHDGVHPVPVAFASECADFLVAPVDAPGMRIKVIGNQVSLFDMAIGRVVERRALAAAPAHWQDFALTRGAAVPGNEKQSGGLRAQSTILEFQESALFIGAAVTLVGELQRSSMGQLQLVARQFDAPSMAERGHGPWVTSVDAKDLEATSLTGGDAKELSSSSKTKLEAVEASLRAEKVMISDDPELLSWIELADPPSTFSDILS